MSEFRIRVLTPKDWKTYKSVRLNSLEDSPDSFGSTYEQELLFTDSEWQARLNPKPVGNVALPLIAEVQGKEAGLASGLIWESDPTTAHVYQMWVSPSARGKGIAKCFLSEIKQWAINKECTSIVLAVTTTNDAAVGLYLSFGFKPVGGVEELRVGSELLVQPMVMELRYAA